MESAKVAYEKKNGAIRMPTLLLSDADMRGRASSSLSPPGRRSIGGSAQRTALQLRRMAQKLCFKQGGVPWDEVRRYLPPSARALHAIDALLTLHGRETVIDTAGRLRSPMWPLISNMRMTRATVTIKRCPSARLFPLPYVLLLPVCMGLCRLMAL